MGTATNKLLPPNGIVRPRKRRRRKFVVAGLSLLLGICYLAENIGWLVSIHKDAAANTASSDDLVAPTTSTTSTNTHSAFCLLIKDDNDILREWVAYHYHVFSMRRLIVAMDPDSQTSPMEVLQSWVDRPELNLQVTLWEDKDYTPDYFQSDPMDYSKLINSVHGSVFYANANSTQKNSAKLLEPIVRTDWHKNTTYVKEHQEEVRAQVLKINSHRFRQKNFVSECFRQIKSEHNAESSSSSSWLPSSLNTNARGISWAVHIDTDEYLVPNPWIASFIRNTKDTSQAKWSRDQLQNILPAKPTEGSLWKFFEDFVDQSKRCVMMPRILFGSKEDDANQNDARVTTGTIGNATTFFWNHQQFESLRWKYHETHEGKSRPKSMVMATHLSDKDEIFKSRLAKSIHRPLREKLLGGRSGCPAEPSQIHNPRLQDQPIAVHHYLGSLERYLARSDARRDPKIYKRNNEKASVGWGDENHLGGKNHQEPFWIEGWLDDFVETHGAETAYAVLPEPYATRNEH